MRKRACGVLLKEGSVLLVRHVHDGHDYWTLPGGGVEEGEAPEDAAVREVEEETGIRARVVRFLCDNELHTAVGDAVEKYYLMDGQGQEPVRGTDPELKDGSQMIVEVGWFPLSGLREDVQVGRVIEALEGPGRLSGIP